MGLMPPMAQVVYLLPSASGLTGPANSGLTGPAGQITTGGPAASFPGNMVSLQGSLPTFFMPHQQLPLMLEGMPEHQGGNVHFIEPMSGRSNGMPWGGNLLAPAPFFDDAAFSARGAPPARPVPQKSTSPRDSNGKQQGDGLQTLLDAVQAQGKEAKAEKVRFFMNCSFTKERMYMCHPI